MDLGQFCRLNRPSRWAGAVAPSQSAIELPMDLVAALDGLLTHLARLGALECDVMLGAKPFSHGLEALTGPGKQGTKRVKGGPIVTVSDALIGHAKLLPLGVRCEETSALLWVIEPGA